MMMQIDQNSLDLIAVSSRAIFLYFIYSEVLLNVATFLALASYRDGFSSMNVKY